jgi:hypothetical protein
MKIIGVFTKLLLSLTILNLEMKIQSQLGMLGLEDHKFKASLDYIARPCLKTQKI